MNFSLSSPKYYNMQAFVAACGTNPPQPISPLRVLSQLRLNFVKGGSQMHHYLQFL